MGPDHRQGPAAQVLLGEERQVIEQVPYVRLRALVKFPAQPAGAVLNGDGDDSDGLIGEVDDMGQAVAKDGLPGRVIQRCPRAVHSIERSQ